MEVVLEARGLVKDYRRARAVDGVDLVVHAGERVALLGPNGAGKTTTLLMLLGVISPDEGAVDDLRASRSPATAATRPRTSASRPATCRSPSASACGSTSALRQPLRPRRSRRRRSQRAWPASASSTSPTRWAPSSRRVSGRWSASCGRRCTGRGCWCSTSRRHRSIPTCRVRVRDGAASDLSTRTAPRCS